MSDLCDHVLLLLLVEASHILDLLAELVSRIWISLEML